ncbi:MAG: Gfo/Idh/MocA family oxidoreductase [Actinomycetota bacterium]|nr:Gfo/Idh/MocA family oxidoreductase [Actinomycetota bacterium]
MWKLDLGIVGLGYWGPNLMRSLNRIGRVRLKYACDLDEGKRARFAAQYPETRFTGDFEELLADEELEAVVVAAPVSAHAALAREVLKADKDVFVEKPLALSPEDAEDLVKLAADKDRILMVGHLLEYHPAVIRLKEIVDSGELGEIFYVYTHRLNLGVIRPDENALWSLAPHDLSVSMYLLEQAPMEVQAIGHSYLKNGVEDVVFGTLRFGDGKIAHLHVSWLDPHKERKITVVGSEKMVVFDDMSRDEKIKLYDKGVEKPDFESYGEYIGLRFGDILIPHVPNDEPLKLECEHFVECLVERKRPRSDGHNGLRVVRTLDALQRSLEAGGQSISLEPSRV